MQMISGVIYPPLLQIPVLLLPLFFLNDDFTFHSLDTDKIFRSTDENMTIVYQIMLNKYEQYILITKNAEFKFFTFYPI